MSMKIIGVNTRSYPVAASGGMQRHDIVCVLVEDPEGIPDTYMAYIAIGSPRDAALAARHGDKLRFEEACCHFPGGQLDRARYRE